MLSKTAQEMYSKAKKVLLMLGLNLYVLHSVAEYDIVIKVIEIDEFFYFMIDYKL